MKFSQRDITILRELSEDSRKTVTYLSKVAKCSRITTKKTILRLEKELRLRYTLEINDEMLSSANKYLLTIKLARRPEWKLLDDTFRDDGVSQAVYQTEGDYDLIVYARADDIMSYIKWETSVASRLADYKPVIKPSGLVISQFGYMPLNDDFVDHIKSDLKVTDEDRKVMRLLNQNSRMSYENLAKSSGLNEDTVRYRIYRLMKSGIIKRFTVAAQQPPDQNIVSAFVNYRFHKGAKEKFARMRSHYAGAEGGAGVLNAFQMLSHVSGSYRLFVMAIFDSEKEAMEKAVKVHEEVIGKEHTEIVHARVMRVLKGLLPFRNLDISQNFVAIDWF